MKVEIKSDGPARHSVSIDGEQVNNVRAMTVRLEAGQPAVVTMELINPAVLGLVEALHFLPCTCQECQARCRRCGTEANSIRGGRIVLVAHGRCSSCASAGGQQ